MNQEEVYEVSRTDGTNPVRLYKLEEEVASLESRLRERKDDALGCGKVEKVGRYGSGGLITNYRPHGPDYIKHHAFTAFETIERMCLPLY